VAKTLIPAVLAVIIGGLAPVAAKADPISLYKSIAQNVASAKGRVVIHTRQGRFKVIVAAGGPPSQVFIDTAQNQRAIATFDYSGGNLNSAAIEFRPAIHLTVAGPPSESITVSKVKYDEDGEPSLEVATEQVAQARRPGRKPAPRIRHNIGGVAPLLTTLRLERTPSAMLAGAPFKFLHETIACPSADDCNGESGPFVTEVELNGHGDTPGLSLVLRDGAQVRFGPSNVLTFFGSTSLTLDNVDYVVDDSSVTGQITKLAGTLQSPSQISNDGLALQFKGSSAFQIQNISFCRHTTSCPNLTQITTSGGLARGNVNSLSSLNLAGGNKLFLDDNTNFNLVDFNMTFSGNGLPRISLGDGSTADVTLRDGFFVFGPDNHVEASSGHLAVQLHGIWPETASDPSAEAVFQNVNVQLSGGEFSPTPGSHLYAASRSQFSATQLTLPIGTKALEGSLTLLSLNLAPQSTYLAPGGFAIEFTQGASVTMDTSHPLTFQRSLLPTGKINLTGGFEGFVSNGATGLTLSKGNVNLDAQRAADGTVSGTVQALQGSVGLVNAGLTLTANARISGLDFSTAGPNGFHAENGQITMALPKTNQVAITSPAQLDVDGHPDMAIYPVTVNVAWTADTQLPTVPIQFDSQGLQINTDKPWKGTLALNLFVPPGKGEHDKRKEVGSADSTHGPDEFHHSQEVVQDTFHDPLGCIAHVYLNPNQNVPASADITFQSVLSGNTRYLDVELNHLSLQSDVGFGRDGCNLGAIVQVFVPIITTLVGIGPVPGLIVGHIGANEINGTIDGLIEGRIQNTAANLHASWTFQTPKL
jgi:hypothetical protein